VKRGLSAVSASREDRNKIKRPPWRAVVFFMMTVLVAMVAYFKWDSNRNGALRAEILSKQRAVDSTLGAKWFPMRDQVEAWTMELAKAPTEDVVDREALATFKSERTRPAT
jgi:hypothetical protein